MSKLPESFYRREDVEAIARDLLNTVLHTHIDGHTCAARIVETEAYAGTTDRACHAYGGRRTKRTSIMYMPGGHAYVYLIYGLYHLFNVVTHKQEEPYAVLIRAVQPLKGVDIMRERRNHPASPYKLTAGPGLLTRALGITTRDSGIPLTGNRIWLEESDDPAAVSDMCSGPRIGVDYAGPDALLHRRFWLRNNPWVSKKA
ncbi:MAG: DNA-3-methyladenine glycosylase [Calditrichaeota bacterium]|nr:MAG: DNA-3-methyladenine glycosylase [Calditrichota bacterium]